MLSAKLTEALKDIPKAKEQLDQIADKFSKRAMRLGQGEPIVTRETMHLMAVEMQLVLRSHGLDARVIIEKKGEGASVVLTSPEEQKKMFEKKEKTDGTT